MARKAKTVGEVVAEATAAVKGKRGGRKASPSHSTITTQTMTGAPAIPSVGEVKGKILAFGWGGMAHRSGMSADGFNATVAEVFQHGGRVEVSRISFPAWEGYGHD